MKTTTCGNKIYEIRSDEAFKKTNAYMLFAEYYMQIYMADNDPLTAEFTSDDGRTHILLVYLNGNFECYSISVDNYWRREKVCLIGAGCNDDNHDALFIEDIQSDFKDWLNMPAVKKELTNLDMFDLCIEC